MKGNAKLSGNSGGETETTMNENELNRMSRAESLAWAQAVIWAGGEVAYSDDDSDRTIVGEDDRAYLYAPMPGHPELWELFDATRPEHRAAAEESARRHVIAMLEFEPEGAEK